MLHFVIGCAVVVGVWYQFILPERRAKAQRELSMWMLDGIGWHEARAKNPAAFDQRINRLRPRAGFPAMPVEAKQQPITSLVPKAAAEPLFGRFGGGLYLLAFIGVAGALFAHFTG